MGENSDRLQNSTSSRNHERRSPICHHKPDTFEACKKHMAKVIMQAKQQLDKYEFEDVMDDKLNNFQGQMWSEEFEEFVIEQIIPPIKVKKEGNNEATNDKETRQIDEEKTNGEDRQGEPGTSEQGNKANPMEAQDAENEQKTEEKESNLPEKEMNQNRNKDIPNRAQNEGKSGLEKTTGKDRSSNISG